MGTSKLRNKARQIFYWPSGNPLFRSETVKSIKESFAKMEKALGKGVDALNDNKDDKKEDDDKDQKEKKDA